MLNRKMMASITAAAALACAGASFGGGDLTDGPYSSSFADTTDWGVTLLLPQFDDMGGIRILNEVKIEWEAGVAGSARVESLDVQPSTITATLAADINISGPSGFDVNPSPSADRVFMATAYDGMIDFGGTSGVTFDEIAAGDSGMVTFSDPYDLMPFIGNGDVNFPASAQATSTATGPGNVIQQFMTDASAGITVTYTYVEEPRICINPADVEPNDTCDPLDIEGSCSYVNYAECEPYINGKLEKRIAQGCEPDTYMVLFDKLNNVLAQNDNGSNKGNGWASGLFGVNDANGIVDNGDGTRSIRIGVTGRPDGLDGVFNGLFQNAAHNQFGKFTMYVTFLDANGEPLISPILPQGGGVISNPVTYTDEFITGAEAFYINYVLPQGTVSVDVCIDNVIPWEQIREDVDFFCIENLIPLCDYAITQVGGLDWECIPTATAIGWFDKNCNLILKEQGNLVIPGYTQLLAVADANGRIIIAVSGAGDCNFNGILDEHEEAVEDRAPGECDFIDWGHGVAGCYTLRIDAYGFYGGDAGPPIVGGPFIGGGDDTTLIQNAMDKGDINMDGVTDTADLGILLGNFGWIGE